MTDSITTIVDADRSRALTIGLAANVAARVCWGGASYVIGLSVTADTARLFEQRLFWAFALMTAVVAATRQWRGIVALFGDRRLLVSMIVTAGLIGSNWFLVIWCVKHGALVSAGIGFFVAPILTIAGGIALLGERRSASILVSVTVCLAGVAVYFYQTLSSPWTAIAISASSAAYALMRKRFPIPAIIVNTAELGVALVVTTVYLVCAAGWQALLPPADDCTMYYVSLGVVTTVPMLLYLFSLKHISASSAAYLQYITPTFMLFIAIILFHESVSQLKMIGISLIWISIIIYMLDSVRYTMARLRLDRMHA